MDIFVIFMVVLVVLIVGVKLLGSKKPVGGKCKTCPEYPYCGGGRPRCTRRSGGI